MINLSTYVPDQEPRSLVTPKGHTGLPEEIANYSFSSKRGREKAISALAHPHEGTLVIGFSRANKECTIQNGEKVSRTLRKEKSPLIEFM